MSPSPDRARDCHARRRPWPSSRGRELAGGDVLAGQAVHDEDVAVARRLHDELPRLAVDLAVDEHRRLRRVPVVRVVWRRREVPGELAGVHVDGHERARIQVVAFATGLRRVRRRRIARADDVQLRLGIVDAGNPHVTAAVTRGVEALPRLQPGIARFCGVAYHRHCRAPVSGSNDAGTRRVEIVAGRHEHVVLDHDRRHRREVLLAQLGDRLCHRSAPVRASSDTR